MEKIKTPYDYSIRLLSKRDYSRFKLKQKLVQRGFEESEIEDAIEELVAKNLLREEEYMRIRVKTLMLNGHANRVIQMKLEQEELYPSDEFIDCLRGENNMESDSVVDALIEKKLRGKVIPSDFDSKMKLQNKVLSHLVSKGYDYNDINEKVSAHIDERIDS